MKRDRLVVAAASSAALAIAAGAFGAHGAAPPASEWLRTGAIYQLTHGIAALVIADRHRPAAWTMLGGAALFAASLYAMALGAPRFLGAVTPIGGFALIGAWLWLAWQPRA